MVEPASTTSSSAARRSPGIATSVIGLALADRDLVHVRAEHLARRERDQPVVGAELDLVADPADRPEAHLVDELDAGDLLQERIDVAERQRLAPGPALAVRAAGRGVDEAVEAARRLGADLGLAPLAAGLVEVGTGARDQGRAHADPAVVGQADRQLGRERAALLEVGLDRAAERAPRLGRELELRPRHVLVARRDRRHDQETDLTRPTDRLAAGADRA